MRPPTDQPRSPARERSEGRPRWQRSVPARRAAQASVSDGYVHQLREKGGSTAIRSPRELGHRHAGARRGLNLAVAALASDYCLLRLLVSDTSAAWAT